MLLWVFFFHVLINTEAFGGFQGLKPLDFTDSVLGKLQIDLLKIFSF